MRLQLVPARQGAQWVRRGFRMFVSRPMAFAGLFAAFMFALVVMAQLPGIGWLLVLAILPLGSLGFMIATRHALEGRLPTPAVFLAPLRGDKRRRNALVKVGVAYVASAFLVSEFSNLVDGGAFESLMTALNAGPGTADAAAQSVDAGTLLAILLRFALAALLSIPFWHAPALVYWDGHGWAKALFSSSAACWSNKGAFIVFGLSWMGVIIAFGTVLNIVFGLMGEMPLLAFAAAPLSLILSTVFYVSLYFTFADSFSSSDAPPLPAHSPQRMSP